MTAKPICVRPEAPLEEAANLLLRLKIRRLPVVDEAGKLAGGWVGGCWRWGLGLGLGSGRGNRRGVWPPALPQPQAAKQIAHACLMKRKFGPPLVCAGIISRGNIIAAALRARKATKAAAEN